MIVSEVSINDQLPPRWKYGRRAWLRKGEQLIASENTTQEQSIREEGSREQTGSPGPGLQ